MYNCDSWSHVKEWYHWGKEDKGRGPWKVPKFSGRSGETQRFEDIRSQGRISVSCHLCVWCCSVNWEETFGFIRKWGLLFVSDHYESSEIRFSVSK